MLSLPDPLHPAVVHLPIALAVLIPALALLAAFTIRRRIMPPRTWGFVLLLQLVLVGSGGLALETGEEQEERVEDAVAERPIEQHEEQAKRFQVASMVALAIIVAGVLPGATGGIARGASVVAALVVLAAGVQVGHSGGELVYRHGAASAYTRDGGLGAVSARETRRGHEEEHEDDD
jgi:hypothetical protein